MDRRDVRRARRAQRSRPTFFTSKCENLAHGITPETPTFPRRSGMGGILPWPLRVTWFQGIMPVTVTYLPGLSVTYRPGSYPHREISVPLAQLFAGDALDPDSKYHHCAQLFPVIYVRVRLPVVRHDDVEAPLLFL